MSAFIELVRQHQDALKQHGTLNNDMRRAIAAMLRCQTQQQGRADCGN